MYIKKITLTNVRCFENLEIDFEKPGSSILILGDNGDGKSTIVRCLAIGLCDQSSAAALFRELPGEFVRHGKEKVGGTILIELGGEGGYNYKIVTHIRSGKVFERVEQDLVRERGKEVKELTPDTFPWDRIFVSGYGAGGRTQGSADFQHYRTVDAVYSLFRYDEPLQNPELVIRRLVDNVRLTAMARMGAASPQFKKGKFSRGKPLPRFMKAHEASLHMLEDVQKLLTFILDIREDEQIQLGYAAIELVGPDGKVELGALGDGYKATVTWVLDLLSWWLLREGGQSEESEWYRDITRLHGIVIVDEIEQHLHPRWQRKIMCLLQGCFPHVQFVATSHSPLVISGCENIDVHQIRDGKHTIENPFGWLAEDVYSIMGLSESRAIPFASEVLRRYAELHKKNLSGKTTRKDMRELKQLRRKLGNLPESDPISLTIEIENITNSLRRLTKKNKT